MIRAHLSRIYSWSFYKLCNVKEYCSTEYYIHSNHFFTLNNIWLVIKTLSINLRIFSCRWTQKTTSVLNIQLINANVLQITLLLNSLTLRLNFTLKCILALEMRSAYVWISFSFLSVWTDLWFKLQLAFHWTEILMILKWMFGNKISIYNE
jgi:hypothetical protein